MKIIKVLEKRSTEPDEPEGGPRYDRWRRRLCTCPKTTKKT